MAPHAENQKQCSSKTEKKKIQNELLEKLKLDEEREKKKLEKEAKRRAELEKIKNESLARQADLLAPLKKEKHPVQQKKTVMKSQPKTSNHKKQQSHSSENKSNQSYSYTWETKPSVWNNKRQTSNAERRIRLASSSSESSWKRDDRNYQSNSRYAPVSNSLWGDTDEHFPMLGAEAPVPQVNVWEERKYKQVEIQALQPQNEYDEEAMLQRALALSMMEASEEEERKRKLEEEYRLQMEALEHNPGILKKFDVLEDFNVADKLDQESYCVSKPNEEQNSKKSFSKNGAVSSFSQKNKTSNSGGARPKINKIIDSFGGWGLKDTKVEKNPASLSNFVDDDVNEKFSRPAGKYNLPDFQTDVVNNNAKKSGKVVDQWLKSNTEVEKTVVSDSWNTVFSNDGKKSSVSDPWENQDLYDGKGTFTDIDGAKSNFSNSSAGYRDVSSRERKDEFHNDKSPDDVLGRTLNSEDKSTSVSNGWDDDNVSGKKVTASSKNGNGDFVGYIGSASSNSEWNDDNASDKELTASSGNRNEDFNGYSFSASSNNTVTKYENSQGSFSNFETGIPVKEDKLDSKRYDSADLLTKAVNPKDTSSDVHFHKKQKEISHGNILSQFESTYNYVVGDTSMPKDGPADECQITLSNDDIWSDKSSNKSATSNSVAYDQNLTKTEFAEEETPVKFGTFEERERNISSTLTSNNEIDVPPILPPQPASTTIVNEVNQTFAAQVSANESAGELPHILPPQAPVDMPSQYMFNPPMFPGVNPMFAPGMDPMTMRQMLMLSNPFFASQLLAMEQYYRALGMPVDLFSFPNQPMPNMPFPGMINTSVEQNTFSNTMNAGASSIHGSNLQNHYQGQSVLTTGSQDGVSTQQHSTKYPPGFNEDSASENIPGSLQNTDEDSWYSSLLSRDSSSVIPPPKAPTLKGDDESNSVSISEPFKPSESAFNVSDNSMNSGQFVNSSSSADSLYGESQKPLSAIEACMTKTEVIGWGDLDDQTISDSKTNTWEDDGWGTDTLPAKSVRNPSLFEDNKKKVFHRQPARQPQLSRFQNNRRFN